MVGELEHMYKELLESDDIPFSKHTSRFTERLKDALPGFTVQTVNRKNNLVHCEEIDKLVKNRINEINHLSLAKALLKAVVPIRQQMAETSNEFQGKFPIYCQQTSIPFALLSLCSLLIDGASPELTDVSQAALSVSQVIMYSYKKQWRVLKDQKDEDDGSKKQRHIKIRETPVPIYIGLTLMTMRAKTVIQKLFLLDCVYHTKDAFKF